MTMKRIEIGIVLLLLILAGCAAPEQKQVPVQPTAPAPGLDLRSIQEGLGMEVPSNWIGFREKSFNACQIANYLPNVRDCSRAYFIQFGFQLSCRPGEEGESVVVHKSDLTPVSNRTLYWKAGGTSGQMRTDESGFGQILAVTSSSMKTKGIRISTGEDFLVMPVADATNIVTPASWCK